MDLEGSPFESPSRVARPARPRPRAPGERLAVVVLAVLASLLAGAREPGCARSQRDADLTYYAAEMLPGLSAVEQDSFDVMVARPDVDLSPYASVILEPLSIEYKPPARRRLGPRNLARIGRYFHETFSKRLEKGGYGMSGAPGPEVLLLRPAIFDFELPDLLRHRLSTGREFIVSDSSFEMTFAMEIRDSVSDRLLYWIADRRRVDSDPSSGDLFTFLGDVRWLYGRWSSALQRELQRAREDGPG